MCALVSAFTVFPLDTGILREDYSAPPRCPPNIYYAYTVPRAGSMGEFLVNMSYVGLGFKSQLHRNHFLFSFFSIPKSIVSNICIIKLRIGCQCLTFYSDSVTDLWQFRLTLSCRTIEKHRALSPGLRVVVHTFNPATCEAETGWSLKFQVSMVYIRISRPAWVIARY